MGDNPEKSGLIPHTPYGGKEGISSETFRYWMSLRWISLLVGQWPTKATIHSWSERTTSHTGTETRPRLLREAAVGNIAQWGKP